MFYLTISLQLLYALIVCSDRSWRKVGSKAVVLDLQAICNFLPFGTTCWPCSFAYVKLNGPLAYLKSEPVPSTSVNFVHLTVL